MTLYNILGVHSLANSADIADGEAWYGVARSVCETIADSHSGRYSLEQVVGVLAALSPNNRWARNVTDTVAFCRAFESGTIENLKVATYHANRRKAERILARGGGVANIQTILNGPKVVEFFNCILGLRDVCIDGHAYSVWRGERIPTTKTPSIGIKLRARIKDDYKAAASILEIQPSTLQAITWVTWRRLYGRKDS